jgi:hypothetical protein
VSPSHRKRALILLGVATVAFTVILEAIDPSHVSHGPTILDFEFVGSRARATQIVAEWGPKGRSAAHLSLLLDYVYPDIGITRIVRTSELWGFGGCEPT